MELRSFRQISVWATIITFNLFGATTFSQLVKHIKLKRPKLLNLALFPPHNYVGFAKNGKLIKCRSAITISVLLLKTVKSFKIDFQNLRLSILVGNCKFNNFLYESLFFNNITYYWF